MLFCQKRHLWFILCTRTHPMTSLPWKWCHLVVGHTLMHTLSKCEVNRTNGSWDIDIFVSPLSYKFPYFDHYQLIHLRHGFRSNTTTTDHPVCPGHCRCYCQCTDSQNSINQPACLWLELSRCIPLLLHILPYLGELAPPQLHTARQRGPPQVCFCSPRHQSPRNACTMDANRQQRGTEGDQGQTFCLPWPHPTRNDTRCQYPCLPWRIGRDCGQTGRGPPRSHCTHQDPDGLLQDDQWWALRAWTTLPYHLCIPPQGKAPRETYG